MTRTGYCATRAIPHDAFLQQVAERLERLGYQPETLETNADEPDLKIVDINGRPAYVDTKVPTDANGDYAIKTNCLTTGWKTALRGYEVYYVWNVDGLMYVDTPMTLTSRLKGGPNRPNGNGSRTDWYLASFGGTRFEDFFPRRH